MQGVCLIITARELHPGKIGLFSLLLGFQTIIALIIGGGLRQLIVFEYYHLPHAQRINFFRNITVSYLAISAPAFALIVIGYPLINHYAFLDSSSFLLFIIVISTAFFTYFSELAVQLTTYGQKIPTLGFLRIFGAALLIIPLLLFKISLTTLLIAYHMSILPLSFYALWVIFPLGTQPPFGKMIGLALAHFCKGTLFLPSLLAAWMLQIANRWFIARSSGLDMVALYSLTDMSFTIFYACILVPLGTVYIPQVLDQLSQNGQDMHPHIYFRNSKFMWIAMGCLFLLFSGGIVLLKAILPFILPAYYQNAIPLIYFRLIGALFLMGTYFTTIYLHYKKERFFLIISLTGAAATNLLLAWFFSSWWSTHGAILALTISYGLYFLVTLLYSSYAIKKIFIEAHKDSSPECVGHATNP